MPEDYQAKKPIVLIKYKLEPDFQRFLSLIRMPSPHSIENTDNNDYHAHLFF
ncbi:hypothetical protein yinte0001_28850 [Yersinia intermedia ATCC 29909]|nr:hypothetical protein yinte0001_28850 [Yersinia intermedia ATCC 29909]